MKGRVARRQRLVQTYAFIVSIRSCSSAISRHFSSRCSLFSPKMPPGICSRYFCTHEHTDVRTQQSYCLASCSALCRCIRNHLTLKAQPSGERRFCNASASLPRSTFTRLHYTQFSPLVGRLNNSLSIKHACFMLVTLEQPDLTTESLSIPDNQIECFFKLRFSHYIW